MPKSFLSVLAVWTLVVGCCFAWSETSVPASQEAKTQALPTVPDTPVTPLVRSEPSVDQQMRTFDHHARVNMILYTGHFGPGERAATRHRRNDLNAIALTLRAGSR